MTLVVDKGTYLAHYGVLRRSGRYPWGSGGPERASNRGFLDYVEELKRGGMSDTDIVKAMNLESTTQLRAAKSIAKNEQKAADIATAQKYKEHGMSNVAIGEKMGINESSVRSLLTDGAKDKADRLDRVANVLKEQVDTRGYIDVGTGTEYDPRIGVSRTSMDVAIARLREEGYAFEKVQVPQAMGGGNMTTIKVLAPPGTTYRDIKANLDKIQSLNQIPVEEGRSILGLRPPESVSSKKLGINYKEDGGADADGVIYLRPGAEGLDLGRSRYAQVRIAVDDTHYIKGMAFYKDDLPKGVDLVFNTNKSDTGNKLDALKEMKKTKDGSVDMDNPFGSMISRQAGKLNIVNEEGAWEDWSRNFSSQMLSKQSPKLAKDQLAVTHADKKADLDEILKLTNPAVRRTLLEAYADSADAAAVHLKAAALPRTANHVILPINKMKETEIYAPNYRDGEMVSLIRFPHGGTFEIPELRVNNRNPEAKKAIGRAKDAVGIHSKVAERLSGADFDGDTVLVIPNNRGSIQSTAPLKALKGFDPKDRYPAYDGMKTMAGGTWNAKTKKEEFPPGKGPSSRLKGQEMGKVSNLITDMTIKGASTSELARAVSHSMVVIDAEKHRLNYKQSEIDFGIPALKKKYQTVEGRPGTGAATLISRATSRQDVLARKRNYRIDPATGKKIWIETGENWVGADGKTVFRTQRSEKLKEVDNAHDLSSGTKMESIYADHSNSLKALADKARYELVHTQTVKYSESAFKAYRPEVDALNAKLSLALQNRPRERQAQLIANANFKAKRDNNPDMDEAEEKKVKYQALEEARIRTGAKKELIDITDREWEAIQAGAITNNRLTDILKNSDLDRIRELATPRTNVVMTPTKIARAKAMAASGYTQADIADALGVSLGTLKGELE
jgi:hypothetical protein